MANHQYTIDVGPPPEVTRERFSLWEQLFEECREYPEQWRRTLTPLKKSTATQLASDIRNSHRRAPGKSRLRGMLPGERWEAAWGEDEPGSGQYYIWIRYCGQGQTVAA